MQSARLVAAVAELGSRPLSAFTVNLPDIIRLGIALSLAAMTMFLFFTAGLYGHAAALVLGTFVSTFVICFIGGRRRVLFTAVATVPPMILIYAEAYREGYFDSPENNIMSHAGGIGLFVALPIVIAYVAGRFDEWLRRNSWPPRPPRAGEDS